MPRIELANCEDLKLFVKQINESNLLSTYCVHLTFVHLENNVPEVEKLEDIKRRAAIQLDFKE